MGASGMDSIGINLSEMLGGMLPKRSKKRRMKVSEARRIFSVEEAEKLIDAEALSHEAIEKAQEDGIIFLDEIDKIVARGSGGSGPDVSREGVQRDLLPIVEGSVVQTRYGPVKTDHVLFIAAGAFSGVKPSDLIPELQGRFPIRVELKSLKKSDFLRILTEPKNNLINQYKALLKIDNVELSFKKPAIEALAAIAEEQNESTENIGARRLQGILEQLLEEISFSADGQSHPVTKVEIDKEFVEKVFKTQKAENDLKKYIL